jgi:hypothetical protein
MRLFESDLLNDAWACLTASTARAAGSAGPAERPAIELEADLATAGLPSRFQVAETAIASVGLALLAACSLAEQRNGVASETSIHPGHVGSAVTSERHFRVGGESAGTGFAPLSRFWRTGDGWVRTHANYPWHREALLRALGVDADPARVGEAMGRLSATDVEDRVVSEGGVAAAVRAPAAWSQHPQGSAVALEPLIGCRSILGAPPRQRRRAASPAEGVRVLDLTRVIAGPVCTRYLGALGADVLRIDPPRFPDMPPGSVADTLLGKRSAGMDFAEAGSAQLLHELLDEADAVVIGYRSGSLVRFGLEPDDIAERHPGLVIVSLNAWGHTGPWAARRGFDSVVQAPTGIAVGESPDGDLPGALPCQLLDHGTGYLAAASLLDGLRRQSSEGGTHVRTLSLARTASWLVAAGDAGTPRPPSPDAPPTGDEEWTTDLRGSGPVSAVAPPGRIDGVGLRWAHGPARYLSDPVAWS